ncbi:hypothetical protein RB595_007002 [Gaeumannomyces hyphopodioides]
MSLDNQVGPSQLKRRQSSDGTHSSHHGLIPKRARWQLSTSTSPTPSRDLSSSTHIPGMPLDPLDYDTPMTDALPISSLPTLAANRDDDPIICFGAIGRLPCDFGATAETGDCIAQLGASIRKQSHPCKQLREYMHAAIRVDTGPPVHHALYLDGEQLAILDSHTSHHLNNLDSVGCLSFQGVYRASHITKCGKQDTFQVSINICGPMSMADNVNATLTNHRLCLQHPYALDSCLEYWNPQVYKADPNTYMTHLVGITQEIIEAKALSDKIESVMDNLVPEDLSDGHIYDDIATQLTEHQRQAVDFILKREHPQFCRDANRLARADIGASLNVDSPLSSRGGIIADVMGMGKTLSMITAIVASKNEARIFVASTDYGTQGWPNGPTLVLVPSVQLMDVWQEEIRRHVKPERLQITTFHGSRRAKSASALIKTGNDIVLTTFSTLAADSSMRNKKGPVLRNIEWYRVVLDEAHWIRNQSSKWFKATKGLVSERRWCLSGTPVQNSLNDLASLICFLDIQPFASKANFQAYILAPLSGGEDSRCKNLQVLLSSMCLRRGPSYLNIPRPAEELVEVVQTPEEEQIQSKVFAECKKKVEESLGMGGGATNTTKKFNAMFWAMMRLRRLCNEGTCQRAAAVATASSAVTPKDPDSGPCEECSDPDQVSRSEQFCFQCGRCTAKAKGKNATAREAHTPGAQGIPVTMAPQASGPGGYSSKLDAIVSKIVTYPAEDKSLVFSGWTFTLDLLQGLMERRGVGFLRIDGTTPADQRTSIVDKFSNNPRIAVLLMTIGTGSVGLTITAANRVHLVEPQWNPFVEEQAIARAVRMGQKRGVTVVRYRVRGSVEKSIVDLQRKKSNLAKFTFDGSEDKMSGRLEDLRFILKMDV